jgi:hypothetical protein
MTTLHFTMGALGVPLYPSGAIKSIYSYLSHLSIKKMVALPVPNVLTMGSPHTEPLPYDFLNLYGACLQAPMTPKMKY